MAKADINNWGRWGDDDQRGMLNLQTSESILKALKLVKQGKTYNLSVPLEADGPQHPMFHKTWHTTFMPTHAAPCAFQVADDVLTMVTHSGTHMDALGHCWTDGLLWNGQSTDKVTSYGIEWAGIEQVGQFITRGVMLDIAKYKGVDNLGLGEDHLTEDTCGAYLELVGDDVETAGQPADRRQYVLAATVAKGQLDGHTGVRCGALFDRAKLGQHVGRQAPEIADGLDPDAVAHEPGQLGLEVATQ